MEAWTPATKEIASAVACLRQKKLLSQMLPRITEINRLENEGDRIYHRGVARLYSGEVKAMDVLKWKDVLDQLEEAIDGCEDIANVIESITLKHD